MDKREKSAVWRAIFGAVCLIGAGLILLLNPDAGSAAISLVLGWSLVIAGALGLVGCIFSWPNCGLAETAVSTLILIMGIYLLRNPLALASILGIGLGICLAIQGIGGTADAIRCRHLAPDWIPRLAVALLTLGFGILLIFVPLTTSRILMVVCGIGMILAGVFRLYLLFRIRRRSRGSSRIIDADP